MKTLLKNSDVLNVFTGELEHVNVLLEDEKIIGLDDYNDLDADVVIDYKGKILIPGLIDGHLHVESTLLTPVELAKIVLPHGTTTFVADPHEIVNVCGMDGLEFMLQISENLPVTAYFTLPSCVPCSKFDENGNTIKSSDLEPYYSRDRIMGLAEMMDFVDVMNKEKEVLNKINDAHKYNAIIDGHGPLLRGKDLDKYLAAGITSDHESSSFSEAKEKLRKGQWVMIREGTVAKDLEALLPLFDEPYCHRCLLVTDDKHPLDIVKDGHIDNIIKKAHKLGKSTIQGIQLATINAAIYFKLDNLGAIAPGYKADILVLNDLDNLDIKDVYCKGKLVLKDKKVVDFVPNKVDKNLLDKVNNSFHLDKLTSSSFNVKDEGSNVRVIKVIKNQLITEEYITKLDFAKSNGIDTSKDILKIVDIERHHNTGHIGIGYINGIGLKEGAIASSVSHDSHNIIAIGTNDEDIALACNELIKMGGGNIVVNNGKLLASLPLKAGGLMSFNDANIVIKQNEEVREATHKCGVPNDVEAFMIMAFSSLTVIPKLKMTTLGIIDVDKQKIVSLFVK